MSSNLPTARASRSRSARRRRSRLDATASTASLSPLKVRLLEIREKRDKVAAAKPRQKGAFKLPPQSLLDLAARRARAGGRESARAQRARARAEARGLRRRGPRGRGAAGPGRHDVQIRAGLRHQGQPDRQSRRRSLDGSASGRGANPGAGAGRGRGRNRGAESQARDAFSCARFSKPTNSRPRRASSRSRSARISPGVRWRPTSPRCRIC